MALPAIIAGGALLAAKQPTIRTRIVGLSNKALGFLGLASVAPAVISSVDTVEEDTILGLNKQKLPYYIGAGLLAYIVFKK